jgi:hypothetical protein
VYEDNTATIAMSNNPIINKKSKHIELAFHFFKDFVQQKVVQLFYIASKNQEADLLTKVVGSMDLFYSLIKKVFNLETILTPPEPISKTLMIKSDQSSKPIQELNRKERLQLASMHINNARGNRYINSDEYSTNRQSTFDTKDLAFQEWISDMPFSLLEMSQLSDILADDINDYAKDYQRFFPKLLQYNDKPFFDGFEKLKQYHQFMEDNVYAINIMRQINILLKKDQNASNLVFTKTEIESMIEASITLNQISDSNATDNKSVNIKSNGFCNAIIASIASEDTLIIEEDWLSKDETYQKQIERYNTADSFKNLPDSDLIGLRDRARKQSLKRMEKYLSENMKYIANIKRYGDMSEMDSDERQHLIDQSRLIAINEYSPTPIVPIPLITADNYHEYFPQHSSSSIPPSASIEALSKEYNVKEPEPKELNRLKRGAKELPPKQTTVQSKSSEPIHQIHHKHTRLTEFEKNEFISLVHKLHLDIYTAVITYMAMASSMVDTEASSKSPRKRRDQNEQNEDDYYEQKSRKYGRKFESSDDVDYFRDKYHYDDRDYHDNKDNTKYDDKKRKHDGDKKKKLKSRGTSISDRDNNNNPNLENNNNNNNDNNIENNEEQEEEEEQIEEEK